MHSYYSAKAVRLIAANPTIPPINNIADAGKGTAAVVTLILSIFTPFSSTYEIVICRLSRTVAGELFMMVAAPNSATDTTLDWLITCTQLKKPENE